MLMFRVQRRDNLLPWRKVTRRSSTLDDTDTHTHTMFGQQQNTGFSFGSSNTPSAGATATGSAPKPAFSFGSNTNTGTTPAAAGSAPAVGGFSFGGANSAGTTTAQAAPALGGASGFSFGGKPAGTAATASTTPTGGSTGFSFGAKPAGTTTTGGSTGFSFGAKPAAPALSLGAPTTTQPGAGLFGQSTNAQQQQQQQQQQPQQQPTTFNAQPSFSWSNNKPSVATTTTAAPSTSLVNFGQPQQQALIPIQPQQSSTNVINTGSKEYTPTVNDKLAKIKSSWDATNSNCSMVTHVYNRVDPSFTDFTRPVNETAEEWENAMKNRPKDYNSIPVKCSGFTGLFERNQLQETHVKQTRVLLNEVNDKLGKLNEKHDLHTNAMLLKCKMKQKNLSIKLLKIAINLTILKYKGYPLANDEEILISKFQALLAKLDDPVGLNRVNELWARLSSLKDRYQELSNTGRSTNVVSTQVNSDKKANGDVNGDLGIDEDDSQTDVIRKLVKVLAKQQHGIQFLCELMEEDEAKLVRLANSQ